MDRVLYYIPRVSEIGYIQVDEKTFQAMVESKRCNYYANKVYIGEKSIEEIPQELWEKVNILVEAMIVKNGKYEEKLLPGAEALLAIRNVAHKNLTRKEAKVLFADMENLRINADDAAASTAISIFPILENNNELIPAGTRINWHGTLKRATVDIRDIAENNPDNAALLWEDIDYKEGYRIISKEKSKDVSFKKNERIWWEGSLYESSDSTADTPDKNPSKWKKIK